jgi:hypothetical protein
LLSRRCTSEALQQSNQVHVLGVLLTV